MQVRKALEAGVWDVPTGRLGLQFAAMALQYQMGNWVEHHTDAMVPQAILECYPKAYAFHIHIFLLRTHTSASLFSELTPYIT